MLLISLLFDSVLGLILIHLTLYFFFFLYTTVDLFLIEKNLLKFFMAIPAIPVENQFKVLLFPKFNKKELPFPL